MSQARGCTTIAIGIAFRFIIENHMGALPTQINNYAYVRDNPIKLDDLRVSHQIFLVVSHPAWVRCSEMSLLTPSSRKTSVQCAVGDAKADVQ